MLKKLFTIAAASTIATLACANSAQAVGFTSITIGDKDGFGYGTGAGYQGAYGGDANIDGKGVLGVDDLLPDLNQDKKLATYKGDDFDFRSAREKGNSYITGSGFIDNGSSGSKFTDISLSTSYLNDFYGITPIKSEKDEKVAEKKNIQSTKRELNKQISSIKDTKIKPIDDQIKALRNERQILPGDERGSIQTQINELKQQKTEIQNNEIKPLESRKIGLHERQKSIEAEIKELNNQITELESNKANDPDRYILDKDGNPMTDDEGEIKKSKIPLPGFTFDFEVAEGDIVKDSPMYFNLLFGDYDVKDAKVQFTTANGSFTKELTKQQNSKGQDGLIQSAYVELNFDEVFSQNGSVFDGYLEAKIIAKDEPYLAFDYAELSTNKVSLVAAQSVPEPTAILGFIAFGAYGAGSALKRKKKS